MVRVQVQKAVVHETHHLDAEHENHLYHEHVEVSSEELFFDLIFVAVGIELSTYLKKDVTWGRVLETFLLFTTAWLTWFHTNMLLTRFTLPKIARVPIFCIMLGSLGVAVHAVNESDPLNPAVSGFRTHIHGIFLSLALVRLSFVILYAVVCYQIPLARPFISKYVLCFGASTLFCVSAALSDVRRVALPLWIGALVVELVMYAFAIVTTKSQYRMSVNMEHALERNQLWVILVLGEGIISLVSVSHQGGFKENYYFTVILGFVIVYVLMKLHIRSQLEYDVTADEHALESNAGWGLLFDISQLLITAGMLGLAIGLKLAVSHSQDGLFKRSYAVLLTGSLSITLLSMNLSRSCHKFAEYEIWGLRRGRHIVWAFHSAISALILPLGLVVDVQGSGQVDRHNFPPPALLFILSILLLFLLRLESMLKQLDEPDDEWAHAVTIATQTDISHYPSLLSVRLPSSTAGTPHSGRSPLNGHKELEAGLAGNNNNNNNNGVGVGIGVGTSDGQVQGPESALLSRRESDTDSSFSNPSKFGDEEAPILQFSQRLKVETHTHL